MQANPIYKSKQEILEKAKTANGHLIKDFNVNNRNLTLSNKGIIGQIIEEGVFGYPINNRAEPDFAKLGVELKVTGLKQLKNKSYVAKERLVLNVIDFFKEAEVDFEHSSFWKKNQNLLLMFYLYKESIDPGLYPIIDSILYTYPVEDLKIIKDDWELISKKINDGEAHLISEADTMYLAACTKGSNGEAMRLQPFSKIPAKQRAFCLKNSYINQVIHNFYIGDKCEKILSVEEIKNNTFEAAMTAHVKQYIGMSESQLKEKFNLTTNSKNEFELLTAKMLNIKGKINRADEILKANITVKTIRVEENNRIIESMSFPTFEYEHLVNEEWGDSDLRNMFYDTKFMFVIFKKQNNEYKFSGIKFWNMPVSTLDKEVFDVWQKTKNVVKNGEIIAGVIELKDGSYITKTNFPGMKFNGICHVRPHARNSEDTYMLPKPDVLTGQVKYTKHCFWLNNTYIEEIIGVK